MTVGVLGGYPLGAGVGYIKDGDYRVAVSPYYSSMDGGGVFLANHHLGCVPSFGKCGEGASDLCLPVLTSLCSGDPTGFSFRNREWRCIANGIRLDAHVYEREYDAYVVDWAPDPLGPVRYYDNDYEELLTHEEYMDMPALECVLAD
jgi:hypothetical protein